MFVRVHPFKEGEWYPERLRPSKFGKSADLGRRPVAATPAPDAE